MPEQDANFDLIVLGSGTAGFGVAKRCREAGWRVALVESRDFGGTCALRGCEPKKTFWTLAEAAERARRLAPHGVAHGEAVTLDWPAAQRFKRSFTDPVPASRLAALEEAGIEAIQGAPRFVAPDAIAVDGHRLQARHILIATGAAPAVLPIEGAEHLSTSDDFLDLEAMPDRLVFLGGGYISFECAHLAVRAGAAVTILEGGDQPLAPFDPQLVAQLVAHGERLGIAVETGCKVSAIERHGGCLRVLCENGRSFAATMAVHGLGRHPAIGALDLDAGGVAAQDGRLQLDDFLRSTSNPRVFAAGDAAGQGPALTPVASQDADVVARNLLEGCNHRPDYRVVPSVAFTLPPLASVGLTEAAARKAGQGYELRQGDMAEFQTVRRTAEPTAAYKLLLEPGSGRILGAHLLGPEAAEVITLFAFAMRFGVDAAGLRAMMTAYPTGASNISNMLRG